MAAHICVFLFLYFYFCIFVKKKGWKLLSPPAHLSPPQPQSETRLRIQTLGGIHRRETEEHTSKLVFLFHLSLGWIIPLFCLSCFSVKAKQQNHPRILFRPLIASSVFRRISNALLLFDRNFLSTQIWKSAIKLDFSPIHIVVSDVEIRRRPD